MSRGNLETTGDESGDEGVCAGGGGGGRLLGGRKRRY